jgi:hypothetical protein
MHSVPATPTGRFWEVAAILDAEVDRGEENMKVRQSEDALRQIEAHQNPSLHLFHC